MLSLARRKRKRESSEAKLNKLKKKLAREGNGVFHAQKQDSVLHTISDKYVESWNDFCKENLGKGKLPCPSIILVDIMYEGNVGSILRNCCLLGF